MTYDNETYLQSLEQSRGDVNRQVQNTLSEVARQRNVAGAAIKRIPGAVETVGKAQMGMFNKGTQGVGESLSALGLGHLGSGPIAQATANAQQRIQANDAAYAKASGLLDQGAGEQAAQRKGSVENTAAQLQAQIDQQKNAYIAQRAAEDRERAAAAEQSRLDREQQQRGILAQRDEAAKNRAFTAQQNDLDRKFTENSFWRESTDKYLAEAGTTIDQALPQWIAAGWRPDNVSSVAEIYEYFGLKPPGSVQTLKGPR